MFNIIIHLKKKYFVPYTISTDIIYSLHCNEIFVQIILISLNSLLIKYLTFSLSLLSLISRSMM